MKALITCMLSILAFALATSSYSQRAKVAGTVSDQFGSLPGAKVEIARYGLSASADVNGNFLIEVEPGTYKLKASFVMYSDAFHEFTISEGDSLNFQFILESNFDIDQEVSVGTRSRPRTLLESTVPIDVISQQTIANSSQIELGQILHYAVPSFHSTHQTVADGTDHIDPATLRGLGPDQVLVLINGKRRHTSSLLNVNGTLGRGSVGTDFNAIPFGAVDRIEILRDGAAAQYGSDAIAGVINIILKEKTGITHIDNRYGINKEGDGETAFYSGNVGFNVGDEGFANFTLEYRDRATTNRSGGYTGEVYLNNDPLADDALIRDRNFFGNTGYSDNRVMEVGNSATRNISFFLNMEVPISTTAEFYGHGGRSFRDGEAAGFYRFPKDSSLVVQSLFPEGFSPRIHSDIQDDAVTFGLRGIKNNWNVDISNTSGKNKLDFNVNNSNNASLGDASPNEFYSGGFVYRQNTTDLDISRTMNWFEGVSISFGAEMRIENYEILAGEEDSWVNGQDTLYNGSQPIVRAAGAQVFPGFQPENELNEFRTNNGWYLDVESKFSKRLLIGAAARFESYSDFGDQGTWKLSGRYSLGDRVSITAGLATGFRAPSLHQVYFNNISTQFIGDDVVRVGTFNNQSTVAQAFNIDQLKAEVSNHISAGLTAKVNDNLSARLDFYSIKIKDRIVLSGRFDEGYEAILGPLNVGAAQFFTNAIDTRTSGLDFSLTYKDNVAGGELLSSLVGNFTSTNLDGGVNASSSLIGQEETLFNREEVSRIESIQPSFKIVSNSTYKFGSLAVTMNHVLFGRVAYVHPDDQDQADWVVNDLTGNVETRDQVFEPKLVSDIAISYQFNDNFRLTLGGHNIFNVYPDQHRHSSNISEGRLIYSRRVQQFGVKGSHYFVKISLNL